LTKAYKSDTLASRKLKGGGMMSEDKKTKMEKEPQNGLRGNLSFDTAPEEVRQQILAIVEGEKKPKGSEFAYGYRDICDYEKAADKLIKTAAAYGISPEEVQRLCNECRNKQSATQTVQI